MKIMKGKNITEMKTIFCALAILGYLLPAASTAQENDASTPRQSILAEAEVENPFNKKLRVGLSWNQYWGIIKGTNLEKEHFAKPCVGASLRAEYYPLPFIGVGMGFGVQQRGTGLINEDRVGGPYTKPWLGLQGDTEDSTYRQRLRMNTIEVPVTLLLRTPKDVVRGLRLSGAAGLVWINNDYVKDFWHKPEDGFHTITDVSDDYIKQEFGFQCSLGTDIDAGQTLFQVHLVYSRGTKNVYKIGPADGRVETYGFRVAWLF